MKFISLFAGIGGLDLGLERAGMKCVAQVEIDDYCLKVLSKHWPDVPKFKDVRDVGKHNLPTTDLICGGFPCQDVSLAGKRAGLQGKRSTLWTEFYRIICEICPRWVVIENVPGLLSSDNGKFFTKILRELSAGGYDAEWQIVSASALGAPHRRERVFVVAHPRWNGLAQTEQTRAYLEESQRSFGLWNGVEGCSTTFANAAEYRLEEKRQTSWFSDRFSRSDWWMAEPAVGRVANGISNRVDRIRTLGNAVVPQVAEWIGKRIMEIEA